MKSNFTAETELHPLQPFIPKSARILLLGSFPPPHARWSIEFYYPNFQNDMWRIWGLLCFGNKDHFTLPGRKCFDREKIVDFCSTAGIALYDTASAVRRTNGDAADKFLEIVTPTDIASLLDRMPHCHTIVATGSLSAETIAQRFASPIPAAATSLPVVVAGRKVDFWRMPSSSRAYPMALERKAAAYGQLVNLLWSNE